MAVPECSEENLLWSDESGWFGSGLPEKLLRCFDSPARLNRLPFWSITFLYDGMIIAHRVKNVNTTGYSYAAYCSEMSLISEKIVNENWWIIAINIDYNLDEITMNCYKIAVFLSFVAMHSYAPYIVLFICFRQRPFRNQNVLAALFSFPASVQSF